MATQRLVNTNFWRDNYIIDLDPSEKLLFLYLLTNTNTTLAGVYEINIRQIAFDTGFDKEMVQKMLDRFTRDGKMWYEDGYIILRNFAKHQRMNPSIKLGIEREISRLPANLAKKLDFLEIDGQFQILIGVVDSVATDSPQSGTPNLTKLNLTKPNLTQPAEAAVGNDLDKVAVVPKVKTETIDAMFGYWKDQVGYEITAKIKQNREAAAKIAKEYSRQDIAAMVQAAARASEDKYAPRISNFVDLYRKWDDLKLWVKREVKGNRPRVAKV